MTSYHDSRPAVGWAIARTLLLLLMGMAAAVLFVRHATTGVWGHLATLVSGRPTTLQTVPAVVDRIQRLNRLETVVYSLDTVVEGDKSSPIFPDLLAGDRILMVVHGESIAGIDFSKLKPEDVRIDSKAHSIQMKLPESEIFLTALDNAHTRVYARSTGLLVPADQNLESQTRIKAQDQLQRAALSDGILDAARKNARSTITTLLYSLGFQKVDVS